MDEQIFEFDMSSIIAYSGIVIIKRKDLEKLKVAKQKANIRMAGLLVIARDVSPELAKETINSVKVRGIVKASPEVKQVLKHFCR
jgi:hypothetical protein